jgi:hypothetical protein
MPYNLFMLCGCKVIKKSKSKGKKLAKSSKILPKTKKRGNKCVSLSKNRGKNLRNTTKKYF